MRAVLDPNVVVSAVLSSQGTPARVLIEWLGGGFELLISEKLIRELERVLSYPRIRKRITEEEAQELIELLVRRALHAADPPEPPSKPSSDPGDDYLIALAEAQSAVLVSGDGHLLKLSRDLPIYSPKDFLNLIKD